MTYLELVAAVGWKKAGLVECFYLQNRNDQNNQIHK